MKFPLVEVKWRDACTDHGWSDLSEINADQDDELAYTIGFIVRESDTFIWIASTVDSTGSSNARIKIPREMVIEQRQIKVSVTGKRKPRGADKPEDAAATS